MNTGALIGTTIHLGFTTLWVIAPDRAGPQRQYSKAVQLLHEALHCRPQFRTYL